VGQAKAGWGGLGTGWGRLPRPPGRDGVGSHVYRLGWVRVTHDPVPTCPVVIPNWNIYETKGGWVLKTLKYATTFLGNWLFLE
jgi:hypothetical protein